MRLHKAISLGITMLAMLMAATSCKTTEANYRAAYERAVAGKKTDPDSTVYTQIRREMTYRDATIGGDTVAIGTQYVRVTDGGGGTNENIKRYCVVAGQFKQVYTAKSMGERMVDNGYPGAFVVQTREPYYYVIAASYSDLPAAKAMVDTLRADPALKIKAPLPFILNPAQIK